MKGVSRSLLVVAVVALASTAFALEVGCRAPCPHFPHCLLAGWIPIETQEGPQEPDSCQLPRQLPEALQVRGCRRLWLVQHPGMLGVKTSCINTPSPHPSCLPLQLNHIHFMISTSISLHVCSHVYHRARLHGRSRLDRTSASGTSSTSSTMSPTRRCLSIALSLFPAASLQYQALNALNLPWLQSLACVGDGRCSS